MTEGGAVLAYLAVSFVLAALTVRLAPHSRIGRALRCRYWLFPALPALWSIALGAGVVSLARGGRKRFKRLFESVSGHRTYKRLSPYEYYRLPRQPLEPAE